MAAKEYEAKLLREIKEVTLQKYGRFASQLDQSIKSFHEKNLQFANRLAYFGGYFSPRLSEEMPENTEVVELLQTCGNTELNKLLSIIASLCEEMSKLTKTAESNFVAPLALYGEDGEPENGDNNGMRLSAISKFIPVLYDLVCFVNRCSAVIVNVMQQLDAVFAASKSKKGAPSASVEVNGVSFDLIFQYLGFLFAALINIDEVLRNQFVLRKDFVNHKRLTELVSSKSSKFDVPNADSYKLKLFLALMAKIEKEIFDGESMFKRTVDAVVNSRCAEQIAKNSTVSEQLSKYIRDVVSEFETEENKLKNGRKWLGTNALFILYVWSFKKDDRRIMRSLLDTEKKTGLLLIHLKGNCAVSTDKLLAKYLPKSMVDRKLFDLLPQLRETQMKQTSLEKEAKQMNTRLTCWMVQFHELLPRSQSSNVNLIESLQQLKAMTVEGLALLSEAAGTAKNSITLHLLYEKSMSRSELVALCKLVNITKAIQLFFERNKASLLVFLSRYSQYCACVALKCLSAVKERLVADVKKYSEKKLDVISAVILASNCIHGPILTERRRLISSLCCAMASVSMNETEQSKLHSFFRKIEFSCDIFTYLEEWSNCEFLYFNTPVLGNYFTHCLVHEMHNAYELRYFCYALSDSISLIRSAYAYDVERQQARCTKFESDVWQQFKMEYLDRLCTDFETELRLHTHRDLQLGDQSPFKRRLQEFPVPISAEPLRLFNRLICVKYYVESYLNEIAYNLTTIALHDWKTYESMLNFAKSKYQMEFVTSQLPTQTLEQGLDVLEITRNIHVFVSRYLYSLNNQMFIERSSENKHLNVLLIRHVSNSIQTHGFGIISTAVNFTYQFLKKKFYIFSQFLYEEHIKSRLIKDLRYFRESKAKKFPYERAEKFVKGIKVLGVTSDGLSYLDQFRILVSQIGNALGFVRMLRSGAIHCGSNAVNFLPDLEELSEVSFETMVVEEEFQDDCVVAARNLDAVLQTLNRNFSDATDYFRLLSQVFESTFQDPKNYHLKNFYLVLPPLILNYVEYSIISKEKMTRKNKVGASFIDDGFAVGVSYVLHLLNQYSDFDSLQWFSSVNDKINQELRDALSKTNKSAVSTNDDEKLLQTTNLTLKRLELLQKEFDLLNYSLTSCRILFKSTARHEDNEQQL